ncbi:MAG TPA: hypothetical protein VF440_14410 [Novosphingobium sp.]
MTVILVAFFAFAGAFAGAVLISDLRRQLGRFAAVRQALRASPEMREVRYAIRTIEVRSLGARIYRPDFTPAKQASAPLRAAA